MQTVTGAECPIGLAEGPLQLNGTTVPLSWLASGLPTSAMEGLRKVSARRPNSRDESMLRPGAEESTRRLSIYEPTYMRPCTKSLPRYLRRAPRPLRRLRICG
jgi:hypothetical protein